MPSVLLYPKSTPGALLQQRSCHLQQVQRQSGRLSHLQGHHDQLCQSGAFQELGRIFFHHSIQVAATIIQRIQHPCDWRDAGCPERCDINTIHGHEERCGFRQVKTKYLPFPFSILCCFRCDVLTGLVTSRLPSQTSQIMSLSKEFGKILISYYLIEYMKLINY